MSNKLVLLITATIIGIPFISVFGSEEVLRNPRPPTINETKELFDLAIKSRKSQRVHLIANVKLSEPPWTKERIKAELQLENELMRETDRRRDFSAIRSNEIARSHSGSKTLRVQEWYSGKRYRLDVTDESQINENKLPVNTNAYDFTYVNIHDYAFSPYPSFSINHRVRDVQLTKSPERRYAEYRLGRALALDDPVAEPLIFALLAVKDGMNSKDGSSWGIDFQKMESILNGQNTNWSLKVTDVRFDGVLVARFDLEGKIPDFKAMQEGKRPILELLEAMPIHATYWLGEKSGRTVCFQAVLTNFMDHSSFFSECKNFGTDGNPGFWKSFSFTNGILSKGYEVNFKKIDTQANFNDAEIFLPESFTNNSNYFVTDVTSGNAVILQNPLPKVKIEASPNVKKQTYIRGIIFGVFLIMPLTMLVIAYRKKLQNRGK